MISGLKAISGGVRQFGLRGSPYRTVPTWYLRRSLDPIGVDPRSRRLRISALQEVVSVV